MSSSEAPAPARTFHPGWLAVGLAIAVMVAGGCIEVIWIVLVSHEWWQLPFKLFATLVVAWWGRPAWRLARTARRRPPGRAGMGTV